MTVVTIQTDLCEHGANWQGSILPPSKNAGCTPQTRQNTVLRSECLSRHGKLCSEQAPRKSFQRGGNNQAHGPRWELGMTCGRQFPSRVRGYSTRHSINRQLLSSRWLSPEEIRIAARLTPGSGLELDLVSGPKGHLGTSVRVSHKSPVNAPRGASIGVHCKCGLLLPLAQTRNLSLPSTNPCHKYDLSGLLHADLKFAQRVLKWWRDHRV